MIDPTASDRRLPAVTLQGGPLHRVGARLGLVNEGKHSLRLGFAIGFLLWLVGAVLAVVEGADLWSVAMLGAHARLLLAIPLLFACESLLEPRVNAFVHTLAGSSLVSTEQLPVLRAQIDRHHRWTNAFWPEIACLLMTLALAWATPMIEIPGIDAFAAVAAKAELSWAAWWYAVVCLGVLRFLILRWLFRWLLWVYWLWDLSRLRLQLVANHSDGMGGLGDLELVHIHLLPLVMAISVVMASSFAVDIAAGRMTLTAVYPAVVVIVLVDAVLFIGPLLLFSGQLWACRVRALSSYTALGERYAAEFERRWLRGDASREELLGSADIQSMADLSGARQIVSDMRSIPMGTRSLAQLLLAALLPMTPLILFQYPLVDLIARFFNGLVGL